MPAPVPLSVDSPTGLAAATRDHLRWLLLDPSDDVLAACLGGSAPVFGLAGVVRTGGPDAATGVTRVDGVPTLTLPTSDVSDEESDAALEDFWSHDAGRGPAVPADVVTLLAGSRTDVRVRGIHARRVLADDPAYVPQVLDVGALAVLRAFAARTVPQPGDASTWLDLAARVDAQLAAGAGDGWRHADLPPDVEAYRSALAELGDLAELDKLDGLADDAADALLSAVAAGEHPTTGALSSAQLALWFPDAVNDLVRQWLAHPASMSRIGYDGFALGDRPLLGFVELRAGEREDWEPAMAARPETSPTDAPAGEQVAR